MGFYFGTKTRPDEGTATLSMERSYGGGARWPPGSRRAHRGRQAYLQINYSLGHYDRRRQPAGL